MRTRPLQLAAIALATALVTIAIEFPATWLAAIANASPRNPLVRIADAQGTLWSGDCIVVLADTSGASGKSGFALPGRLQWKLSPLDLVFGRMSVRLAHPALAQSLTVEAAMNTLTVSAGSATFDAYLLVAAGSPFNTLKPEGQLRLAWDTLGATTQGFSGHATIDWLQAGSNLSRVKPLGSYRVTLSADASSGRRISMSLSTLEGSMTLEGTGAYSAGTGVTFLGSARADAATKEQLNGLLNVLGPRDGDRAILRF